jgi:hypothetical protein
LGNAQSYYCDIFGRPAAVAAHFYGGRPFSLSAITVSAMRHRLSAASWPSLRDERPCQRILVFYPWAKEFK